MKLLVSVLAALVVTVSGTAQPPATVSFTEGAGNKEKWQPSGTEVYSGSAATRMTTGFVLKYFTQSSVDDIVCFDFSYADRPASCDTTESYGTRVRSIVLEEDEYITEVFGNNYPFINRIGVVTNKQTYGPWGQPESDYYSFSVSNSNKPLLKADITTGVFMYEITFVFSELDVLSLLDDARRIAKETFDTIKSNVVGLVDLDNKYRPTVWYDLAQKGCAQTTTNTNGKDAACLLMSILEHTTELALSARSNMVHQPRNLVKFAEYDSAVFLQEVTTSKQFYNLLTSISFGLSHIATLQESTASALKNYFKLRATFNKNIAEQDVIYIRGKLKDLKDGSDTVASQVGARLQRILGYAMGSKVIEAAEKAVRLAVAIQGAFSPFKVLLGGPDFGAIFEAIDDLLETIGDIIELSITISHIRTFSTLLQKVQNAFAENKKQIIGLEAIAENFDEYVTTDVLESKAASYINSYGAYTPYVSAQDLAELTALLEAMADSACNFIKDNGGSLAANVKNIAQSQAVSDCLLYGPEVAKLDSYFDQAMSMQFELIDALTGVMKGKIAERMSDEFDAVRNDIDVLTATVGTAMMEIRFQSAARARCDTLEYVNGGVRPTHCKRLIYTHTDYEQISAYRGTMSVSTGMIEAYLPTNFHSDASVPVIDIKKLLQGNHTFQLPIKNTTWLEKYDWLPDTRSAETAFYFNGMNLYVPGLKCKEAGRSLYVYVEATSSKVNRLYKEEVSPDFMLHQDTIKFEYKANTVGCSQNKIESFIVKNTDMDIKSLSQPNRVERVCVVSQGTISDHGNSDHTYPSLYNMWNVKIRGSNECTLMIDPLYPFTPMVNVEFHRYETIGSNIDECWPRGSRCPAGRTCRDGLLSYTCT